MVSLNEIVQCPDCEHEFRIDSRVWEVCLTCGRIWEPGNDWRSCNWNDDVDCNGVHAIIKFTEEAAIEKQREVRGDVDVQA